MSRHLRPVSLRIWLLPVIILLLGLSGCGSNPKTQAKGASSAKSPSTGLATITPSGWAPTPTATAGPASTAVTTPSQPSAVCTSNGGTPLTIQKLKVGRSGDYDYFTWEWLPDNLPLTPQNLSSIAPVALGTMDTSLFIDVAMNVPTTSQPGYVCGVTVRVVSFQPLVGQAVNVYHKCVDQAYAVPGGFHPTTACPASAVSAGSGTVTFTSAAVGAEASSSITFQPPSGFQGAGQPAQIPQPTSEIGGPGACCAPNDVEVGIKVPQAGVYTFAVSLWQTSAGPSVTGPNVTAMFLFGQAQREWGGQPCTQPAMQAQLPPATNPPTQVICPGGAPTVQ